jgi:hypothetical protein
VSLLFFLEKIGIFGSQWAIPPGRMNAETKRIALMNGWEKVGPLTSTGKGEWDYLG